MKVLIADDEHLARQRLEKMLEGMTGFEVVGQAGEARHLGSGG